MTGKIIISRKIFTKIVVLQADGGEGQVGEDGEHHGGRGEER